MWLDMKTFLIMKVKSQNHFLSADGILLRE